MGPIKIKPKNQPADTTVRPAGKSQTIPRNHGRSGPKLEKGDEYYSTYAPRAEGIPNDTSYLRYKNTKQANAAMDSVSKGLKPKNSGYKTTKVW